MTDVKGREPDDRLTRRSVRSFVIRNGRMTGAQTEAMQRLLPLHGIDLTNTPQLPDAFPRDAPVWLEVGIGNGDALLGMAAADPEADFIGVEVHAPGVGHALLGIERLGLTNVKLVRHDAIEVLQHHCPPASLERLMLFFPDPWHKKRHHKRRIVQQDFLDAAADSLAPDALLHCATDIDDYATWMHEWLHAHPRFVNAATPDDIADGAAATTGWVDVPRPHWRPLTRFEQRGQRLGHSVHDLLYRRLPDSATLPTVR